LAKKSRKNRKVAQDSAQRPYWLGVVVAAAVLLVVGGLSMLLISGDSNTTSGGGTPKLVVDQTVVDEGYVTLNTPVRTAFTIRNEGDGLLQVLGEPQVQLVEGC
jgi:hypothetical protein